MAREQVTITITSPHGGGLKVAPPDQPQPDDGHNLDLFSHPTSAELDELPAPTSPPRAAESATAPTKPWEDLRRGSKSMNFQPDPELYAKMMWCKENVPMMSLLKLLRQGAIAECDRLIALYHTPYDHR